jgi:hypothetical protein
VELVVSSFHYAARGKPSGVVTSLLTCSLQSSRAARNGLGCGTGAKWYRIVKGRRLRPPGVRLWVGFLDAPWLAQRQDVIGDDRQREPDSAVLLVGLGLERTLHGERVAVGQAHQLGSGRFSECEHLPPLRRLSVLCPDCRRDERLAYFLGALLRFPEELAGYENTSRRTNRSSHSMVMLKWEAQIAIASDKANKRSLSAAA